MIYSFLNSLVELSKVTAETYGQIVSPDGYLLLLLGQLISWFIVFVLFYTFRSIGLFVMAKNAGLKKPWLAIVPFAALYVAQELAPNSKYIKKYKYLYLGAIIAEGVALLSSLICDIFFGLPLLNFVLSHPDKTVAIEQYPLANVLLLFQSTGELVYAVISLILYSRIFKAYTIKNGQSFLIWSALGYALLGNLVLAGIFIFVLRNKQRVNYDEYISERLRRQQAYRNSQYGNPYGRPPYGGNPYVRPPYGDNPYGNHYGQQSNQSEPFEDFKTQDADPFEEFSNESKANTNTNSNSDDDLFN